MPVQVIPLSNSPNQSFTVQLTVDGKPLTLNITLTYNTMAQYWVLGILNTSNNQLLASVPVITGSYPGANLLEQQKYLNIGSWYIVNVSNLSAETGTSVGYGQGPYGGPPGYGGQLGLAGLDYPNDTNLGTDFQLWVDDTPLV